MHPDVTKTIAALRVDDQHAAGAATRLARQAWAGRAAGSLPGSAAAVVSRTLDRQAASVLIARDALPLEVATIRFTGMTRQMELAALYPLCRK